MFPFCFSASNQTWDWQPWMSLSAVLLASSMGVSFLPSPMTYSYLSVQSWKMLRSSRSPVCASVMVIIFIVV